MEPTNNFVAVESEALSIRSTLDTVKITDQASYDAVVDLRTKAKKWLNNTKDNIFGPMKKKAHAAWREICDKEGLVCGPVETVVDKANVALLEWDKAQERERQRLQAEVEEKARQEAEATKIADAVHLEEQGASPEQVEAALSAPTPAPPPVLAAPTYEKSKAVVYRDNWRAQVTDLHALIKYVAKNKDKTNLLIPNSTALNNLAKALKTTMDVPGVQAYNDRTVASGR